MLDRHHKLITRISKYLSLLQDLCQECMLLLKTWFVAPTTPRSREVFVSTIIHGACEVLRTPRGQRAAPATRRAPGKVTATHGVSQSHGPTAVTASARPRACSVGVWLAGVLQGARHRGLAALRAQGDALARRPRVRGITVSLFSVGGCLALVDLQQLLHVDNGIDSRARTLTLSLSLTHTQEREKANDGRAACALPTLRCIGADAARANCDVRRSLHRHEIRLSLFFAQHHFRRGQPPNPPWVCQGVQHALLRS